MLLLRGALERLNVVVVVIKRYIGKLMLSLLLWLLLVVLNGSLRDFLLWLLLLLLSGTLVSNIMIVVVTVVK